LVALSAVEGERGEVMVAVDDDDLGALSDDLDGLCGVGLADADLVAVDSD
jgi:hypothetical protein